MKKYIISVVAILFLISTNIYSQEPSIEQISAAARTYFAAISTLPEDFDEGTEYIFTEEQLPEIENIIPWVENDTVFLQIVNFTDNQGWIMLANDLSISPVMAYGFDEQINSTEDFATNIFVADYVQTVRVAKRPKMTTFAVNNLPNNDWFNLIDHKYQPIDDGNYHPGTTTCYKNGTVLLTKDGDYIKWGQRGNNYSINDCAISYNRHCPKLGGYCGKSPAGCTAVAVAQLMLYHEWPTQAIKDGVVRHYDYNKISPYLTRSSSEEEVEAVSWFLRDVGYGINSVYTSCNTACVLSTVKAPMINKFKYSKNMKFKQISDNFTENELKNIIRPEILLCRPVLYQAWKGTSGHTMVIDGYNKADEAFHVNFGWRGSSNGWYKLTDLKGYTSTRSIIYNIYPDKSSTNNAPAQNVPAQNSYDKPQPSEHAKKLNVQYLPERAEIIIQNYYATPVSKIYSSAGVLISTADTETVDITHLPAGIYYVVVYDGANYVTSKIVRQ